MKRKIKTEHYNYMRKTILDHVLKHGTTIKTLEFSYRAVGLSMKRLRWDLAHAAGLTKFFCDTIYKYAHDEHIDTALRSITGTK